MPDHPHFFALTNDLKLSKNTVRIKIVKFHGIIIVFIRESKYLNPPYECNQKKSICADFIRPVSC
jgi:hypothetical protein